MVLFREGTLETRKIRKDKIVTLAKLTVLISIKITK